jgi:ribosomal protein L37AE/L43A
VSAQTYKFKSLRDCPFCGHAAEWRDHAFYACTACGKTAADLVYEPTPREARWWAFLRRERAAGVFNDGRTE